MYVNISQYIYNVKFILNIIYNSDTSVLKYWFKPKIIGYFKKLPNGVIVFTIRQNHLRVISSRNMNKKERQVYNNHEIKIVTDEDSGEILGAQAVDLRCSDFILILLRVLMSQKYLSLS
jgi:hypothetical protein